MLFIFPILFCFFLLYLELQRSDDADSALWVCSSAGAAQRYPPSHKKAESASLRPKTPYSLWPVGCGPLPTPNQPRSQMPLNLRHFWLKKNKTFLLIQSKMTSNCSPASATGWPPLSFWDALWVLSVCQSGQVFCKGLLVCSWSSASAAAKWPCNVTQTALYGALWWRWQ